MAYSEFEEIFKEFKFEGFCTNCMGALSPRKIAEKLQLTKTQFEAAKTSYETIAEYLDKKIDGNVVKIYPQGSMLLGTTVKPLKNDEFDIDLVCLMEKNYGYTPKNLLNLVFKSLGESGVYKEKIELKERCVRINYTSNSYHLDIVPSIPATPQDSTKILVPDRKANEWKLSDSIGFSKWFESKCTLTPIFRKADIQDLGSQVSIEELPALKVAVQLIKRQRDIFFSEKEFLPASILLTVLAGQAIGTQSLNYNVVNIISLTLEFIENSIIRRNNRIVLNPVLQSENLARKLSDENNFREFASWINDFSLKWKNLLNESFSRPEQAILLKELFGESVVNEIYSEEAALIMEARKNEAIGVGKTGLLTVSPTLTKIHASANTFYGKK